MLQPDIYFFQEKLEVRKDLGCAQLDGACRLVTLRDHRGPTTATNVPGLTGACRPQRFQRELPGREGHRH